MKQYVPTHLQIETVNRLCDARCPMCSIKFSPEFPLETEDDESYKGTARDVGIMSLDTFKAILSKFIPYTDNITHLSLHGCGEPLLDKSLPEKINFAKDSGFRGIGFTSNCTLLTEDRSNKLLKAGLNCIIPSIDGTTKEVHETIRPRTDFEKIVENVKTFIQCRDSGDFNCKVLVRMIRQQLNYNQWDEYERFWSSLMTPEKGDQVLNIDIHNCGGKIVDFDKMKVNNFSERKMNFDKKYQEESTGMCPDLFSRFSIFTSGDVALCSADQSEYYKLGNVLEMDPIEIYNGEIFNYYRKKWMEKKYMELDYCKTCTIAISRVYKSNAI
jgi:MoaA/NifB/PqqE/SkfB family radical SAM enzyme